MTISVKYKADVPKLAWQAPMVFAGNETFAMRDKDVGGRITRRLIPFGFQTKVDSQDMRLEDRIKNDMPRIIWVASWGFRVRSVPPRFRRTGARVPAVDHSDACRPC